MSQIYNSPEPTVAQPIKFNTPPDEKDKEANRQAKIKDAKERVSKQLGKGKNVDASKIAQSTGVSEKRAQKIIDKFGNQSNGVEAQNTDTPVKGAEYQSGQQHYSGGKLVDTGAPNKDNPGKDNNPYTVKKIENFDLAAGGAGAKKGTNRLSAQDIKRLHKQGGFSKQEIVNYAENQDFGDGPGASGGKAQALLSKYKDAIKRENVTEPPQPAEEDARLGGEEETPTTMPTPTPTPTPSPEPTPVDAIQTGENNLINTGRIIGNINQGADFSVNIGGDASDNGGVASDNMKNAVNYSAINDNAFAKSQAQMNGLTRSTQAIQAADELTGAAQGIANDDYLSGLDSLYLGAKATQARTQLYGDLFKFEAPEWMQPKPGKKPEDKTKKIADLYKIGD